MSQRSLRSIRRAALGSLGVLLPLLAPGCDDGGELTQIMVVVTSDLDVPAEIDEVRIEVSDTSMDVQRSGGSLTDAPLPRTVGLVHDGGSLGPFTVTANGLLGGSEVVQRSATLSFDEGRVVELELRLESACVGMSCGDGQTCDGGSCVDDSVDSSELPDWEGDADAGVPDAGPCPGVPERCNDRDDDCDGDVDEGFDLNRDPVNCGGCGNSCTAPENASPVCRTGSCGFQCDMGFSDCDGNTDNGCEADLSMPATCGACMNDCRIDNTMVACNTGMCEVVGCDAGFDDCNDDASDGCETSLMTSSDCGSCGTACTVANATATCATGSCDIDTCDAGFGDCNDDPGDGCETPLDTLTDCGACGTACDLTNATATCASLSCEIDACDAGFDDCNTMASDGCETSLSTLTDCGSCGMTCDLANATESCDTGSCEITTCDANFDDCDGTASNGCEIDLRTDDSHCGSCGNACDAGARCVASECRDDAEVIGVAAGELHSCGVRVGGEVLCWGDNADGQLGDGGTTPSDTPVTASGLSDASQVGAGSMHSCALRTTGGVSCWGDNGRGQIGDGTGGPRRTPTAVSGLSDAGDIGVGALHNCAVRDTGAVVCWGDNTSGQLGDGSTGGDERAPVTVSGVSDAIAVAAGDSHSCALRDTGAIVCWGDNTSGQLGDGSNTDSDVAVAVSGLSDAVAIAAGGSHTCALRTGGAISCWGSNAEGQLGVSGGDSNTPVDVTAVTGAAAVDTGSSHTCASLDDGTAQCWGRNVEGQLGDGGVGGGSTPVSVSGLSAAAGIAAGGSHSCAPRDDGGVSCWGEGSSGQLGDGAGADSSTPVSVSGVP